MSNSKSSTILKTSTIVYWKVVHCNLSTYSFSWFTDRDWTREETDYLFSLIHEYDVRFYIVADRYDFKPSPPRNQHHETPAAVNANVGQFGEDVTIKEEAASPEKMDVDEPVKTNGVDDGQEVGPSPANDNVVGLTGSANTVSAKPRKIEVCHSHPLTFI